MNKIGNYDDPNSQVKFHSPVTMVNLSWAPPGKKRKEKKRKFVVEFRQVINYIIASTSSELPADPFGASSARNCAETSSMAEFSCAIFSASTFRVFCFYHINKKRSFNQGNDMTSLHAWLSYAIINFKPIISPSFKQLVPLYS